MCFSLVRKIGTLGYSRSHLWFDLNKGYAGITMFFVPYIDQTRTRIWFRPFLVPGTRLSEGKMIGEIRLKAQGQTDVPRPILTPFPGLLDWISPETEVKDFNQELFRLSGELHGTMPYEDYLSYILSLNHS